MYKYYYVSKMLLLYYNSEKLTHGHLQQEGKLSAYHELIRYVHMLLQKVISTDDVYWLLCFLAF